MKITILGAGHGGTTLAGELSLFGHEVTLLKTSNSMHNSNFNYIYENKKVNIMEDGITKTATIYNVTFDFKTALKDVDLIIIFIQTNYHKNLIDEMMRYLTGNEVVLIEPGYLSTAYFLQHEKSENMTIIEAESSPIDCRITSPGHVEILFKNVTNPIGIYPKKRTKLALNILEKLPYHFTLNKSVVESALHNPNLIVHTIGAIFSIPRIEYTQGEYWMYREVFTPSVWNIVEELDKEKMNVLKKLGYNELPYLEACKIRNSTEDRSAKDIFFEYASNAAPKGPSEVNSRFITEDVPEGLVLLESIGKFLGIKTPIATSLINLAEASLNTEFRINGRTIEKLGINNIIRILND